MATMFQRITVLMAVFLTAGLPAAVFSADCRPVRSHGQTVYVSVYSHIYGGPKSAPLDLTATVSIRNTDLEHPIKVLSVKYYDSEGKLIEEYAQTPTTLGPLATIRFIVEEFDTRGGSGAKILVTWKADREVSAPLVEAVMISTRSALGISFVTRGVVLEDDRP